MKAANIPMCELPDVRQRLPPLHESSVNGRCRRDFAVHLRHRPDGLNDLPRSGTTKSAGACRWLNPAKRSERGYGFPGDSFQGDGTGPVSTESVNRMASPCGADPGRSPWVEA